MPRVEGLKTYIPKENKKTHLFKTLACKMDLAPRSVAVHKTLSTLLSLSDPVETYAYDQP
jgi:hypothetical protein